MSESFFLTESLAKEAIRLTMPTIQAFMNEGIAVRHDLHIVILDPAIPYSPITDFTETILVEHSLGDVENWQHDYAEIACGKAANSWRTGKETHDLRSTPWLYRLADVRFAGSSVRDNIIVACSGVQGHFDRMFAGMIREACEGLCIDAYERYMASNPPGNVFSPQ